MKWTFAVLAGMSVWTGTVAAHAVDSSFLTFHGSFPIQRYLFAGQMIESPSCKFRTVMQDDGNLVTYDNQNHAVWYLLGGDDASLPPASYAVMQWDANFVVYAPDLNRVDQPFWATNTANRALSGKIVQQDDGNLVIYNSAGQYLWASFPEHILTSFSGPCHVARHTDVAFGFDAPGGDFAVGTGFSGSGCGDLCAQDPVRCKAWTWVPSNPSKCFLKSSQPAMTRRTGMISGRIVVGSS